MAPPAPVPSLWLAYSSGSGLIMKRWTPKPAVRYSVPENEWARSAPVKRPWPNSAASALSQTSCLPVGNARARAFQSEGGAYVEADVGINERLLCRGDALNGQRRLDGRPALDQAQC